MADSRWLLGRELSAIRFAYNLHPLRVLKRVPAAAQANPIIIGDRQPVTLEFVVTDCNQHLEHHIREA